MSIQISRLISCSHKPLGDRWFSHNCGSCLNTKAIAHLALSLLLGAAVLTAPSAQAQARSGDAATANQTQKSKRVRWKPKPERGNVRGTLSGGRRGGNTVACGSAESDTSLRLFVPQGKASLLTTQARPTLAWQVKTQQPVSMELILRDVAQPNPIWVQQFQAHGDQTFSSQLPASAALSPERQYRWSVIVNCASGQKNEIYARSFIRLAARESSGEQRSPSSSAELPNAGKTTLEQALTHAEQGIWYDAAAGLLDLPEQVVAGRPADLLAELLEQAEHTAP